MDGRLVRDWRDIRAEAIRFPRRGYLSLGDISFDHGRIAADRRWRSFFLNGYGYHMGNNCERTPLTTALIEQVPGMATASFSMLEAGGQPFLPLGHDQGHAHLPSRAEGARRARDVPDDDLGSRTGCTLPWAEGQSFVFDDMFNPEVWNETDEDRYILLIQIKRLPARGKTSAEPIPIRDAALAFRARYPAQYRSGG